MFSVSLSSNILLKLSTDNNGVSNLIIFSSTMSLYENIYSIWDIIFFSKKILFLSSGNIYGYFVWFSFLSFLKNIWLEDKGCEFILFFSNNFFSFLISSFVLSLKLIIF